MMDYVAARLVHEMDLDMTVINGVTYFHYLLCCQSLFVG